MKLKFEDLKIIITKFSLVTSSTSFMVIRKEDHSASKCYIRNNDSSIGRMVWVSKGSLLKTNIQGPKKIWVPKSIWLYEWWTPWSEVETLIAVAPNTWRGDVSMFIHISPKNSEYVIYGDNKQRPLDQQSPTSGIKWYQQVTCLWLIAFDYFCLWWLCIRVILIVFDDCFWWLFLIEFWLSLMIFFISFFLLSFDCPW